MNDFRFAVLGAGGIAGYFCEAVSLIDGVSVCAVASKSAERAESFAARYGLPRAYASYARMLEEEKPDCAYIAVTNDAHAELVRLCLGYGIPVLCEKAFVPTRREAEELFALAREKNLFLMEAQWARFTPAVRKAKEWLEAGRVGKARMLEARLGFSAARDHQNRFFNPALGGGAALDIMVYTYELTQFMLGDPERAQIAARFWETGVDAEEVVLLTYPDCIAVLETSILTRLEQNMVIYGEEGRIVLDGLHQSKSVRILDPSGALVEEFIDTRTQNGLVYEIEETVRCIREGRIESPVVPHSLTVGSAALYDMLWAERDRK